jgi:hypothetical protein
MAADRDSQNARDIELFTRLMMQIGDKYTTALAERHVLVRTLERIANPDNWDQRLWYGDHHPIDLARAALDQIRSGGQE